MPAVVVWSSLASGNWGDRTEWTDAFNGSHHVPGPGDDAVIQTTGISVYILGNFAVGTLVDSAELIVDGTLTIATPLPAQIAKLDLVGGGLFGNMVVQDALTWTDGVIEPGANIVSESTLSIGGQGNRRLFGTLVNEGSGTLTADGLGSPLGGGLLDNEGEFVDVSNAQIADVYNNSLFFRSGGKGVSVVNQLTNTVQATVDVQTGTLAVGAFNSDGVVLVEGGSTLEFQGTPTFTGLASLTGQGNVVFDTYANIECPYNIAGETHVNALDVIFDGPYSSGITQIESGVAEFNNTAMIVSLTIRNGLNFGTLGGTGTVIVSGTLNWAGGFMVGTGRTVSEGQMSISSGVELQTHRTLLNVGQAIATGSLRSDGTTLVDNGPTGIFEAGGGFGLGGGDFLNEGLLSLLSSITTYQFDNSGTVQFGPWNLTAYLASTNSGTMEVGGSTFDASGGYTQSAGETDLSGGVIAGSVDLEGGILSAAGTVGGDLTNGGRLDPGGTNVVGKLTILGVYTQTKKGVLDIDIGPAIGGVTSDQLAVNTLSNFPFPPNPSTLAGTLNVHLLNNVIPSVGSSFLILSALNASLFSGSFTVLNGLALPDGNSLVASYATAGVTLSDTIGVTDVSSQVAVSADGLRRSRGTGIYMQSVTITNTGSTPLMGTLSLVLDGLTTGVILFNGSGYTSATSPSGSPYLNISLADGLAVGQSVTVVLGFLDPTNAPISYNTRELLGVGMR
jgi:hypothetical protein